MAFVSECNDSLPAGGFSKEEALKQLNYEIKSNEKTIARLEGINEGLLRAKYLFDNLIEDDKKCPNIDK